MAGLEALAAAAEEALRGGGLEAVERRCGEARGSLAATLLSLRTLRLGGLVDEYLRIYREGLGLVAEALAASGAASRAEAEAAARLLCGLSAAGSGCVMVRVVRGFERGGRLVARGSLVCLPPGEAVALVAAGLAEPLPLLGGDSI